MTTTTNSAFTVSDYVAVSTVIESAIHNSRVRRLIPDDEPGAGLVVEGTARRIGDENGCSQPETDVRELFLWVTTDAGLEVFWPVRALVEDVRKGTFVGYHTGDPR